MMFRLFSKNTRHRISPERKRQLREVSKIFNIRVKSLSNLDRALTHVSSIENADEMIESYERLEFLGDAVLSASVAHILFDQYPNAMEGRLTTIRSALVNEATLSEIALKTNILDYVKVGKGEKLENERARHKVGADIMEALVATIYLDHGFEVALKFISRILRPYIEQRIAHGTRDFKSALQAWSIANYKEYPSYTVIDESGPDHDKEFEVQVTVSSHYCVTAKGHSKKEAEQKAAEKIILQIKNKSYQG